MSKALAAITLHNADGTEAALNPETARAIEELKQDSEFGFVDAPPGPYSIDLSIYNRQLVLKATAADGTVLPHLVLSLSPYRTIIRDYFMMIESYEKARVEGFMARLEPIDMARRGLHNEAADLMIDRLKEKVFLDHATARRIFTLICALHMDQARLWRG